MKEKRYVVMNGDRYLMYNPKEGQTYELTDDFKKASKAADKTAVDLMKYMYTRNHEDEDFELTVRTVIVTYEFED